MISRNHTLARMGKPTAGSKQGGSRKSFLGTAAAMLALGCLFTASSLLAAGRAQARTETLQWQHADPSRVVAFEAEVGNQLDVYDRTMALGLPQPDGSGIYSATITVGDQEDVYIVLRAQGSDGVWSGRSAFRYRPGPNSPPVPNPTPTPPSPGAVIDFESNALSSIVSGWYDSRANFSITEDDTLFDVAVVTGTQTLHTASGGSDIHSHLVAPGFALENYAVRGRMRADSAMASHGVTAYSAYPLANRYYRLAGTPAVGQRFMISSQGTSITCTQANTGHPVGDDEWIRFEFRVENEGTQNRIRAKVWMDGTAEPSAFQQECFDSSAGRPTAGTFGVWSDGAGNRYWDDLEQVVLPAPPSSGGGGGGSSGTPLAAPVLIGISPVN